MYQATEEAPSASKDRTWPSTFVNQLLLWAAWTNPDSVLLCGKMKILRAYTDPSQPKLLQGTISQLLWLISRLMSHWSCDNKGITIVSSVGGVALWLHIFLCFTNARFLFTPSHLWHFWSEGMTSTNSTHVEMFSRPTVKMPQVQNSIGWILAPAGWPIWWIVAGQAKVNK
jgi:hypothetical protein